MELSTIMQTWVIFIAISALIMKVGPIKLVFFGTSIALVGFILFSMMNQSVARPIEAERPAVFKI